MDALIIITVIALIAFVLELIRRHQYQPRSQLAGSSNIVDRDSERFLSDLRAQR